MKIVGKGGFLEEEKSWDASYSESITKESKSFGLQTIEIIQTCAETDRKD